VFQCLEHTLDLSREKWRVLDDAHRRRNNAEYEGVFEVSEALVSTLIDITAEMADSLQ